MFDSPIMLVLVILSCSFPAGVDGPSLPPHQLTVLSENSAGKDATSAFSDSEGEGAEVKEGGSASSSMSEDTLVTVTTDGEGSLEAW